MSIKLWILVFYLLYLIEIKLSNGKPFGYHMWSSADLVLKKFGEITIVQAKRYNNKVTNKAIQEVVASIKYYNAHKGAVITNNEFTDSAIELAIQTISN